MIELTDDNDPYLFSIRIPAGQLILQYMEVLSCLQESLRDSTQPTNADIIAAVRKASRTREVALAAQDYEITAAWLRITKAVEAAGNV